METMMVRKLAVFLLAFILLTSWFPGVGATKAAQSPFSTIIYIRTGQASVNGTFELYGVVNVYLQLSNKTLIEHFNEIAKENETLARKEFHDFIYDSVYKPLRSTFEERLKAHGISPKFYMPQGGDPVYVGKNWSAIVSFLVTPFFFPNGTYLSTLLAGPLTVNVSGHVYPLRWGKLTVFLPSGYYLHSASPKPGETNQNTLTWFKGDYIPSMSVYSMTYLFVHFVNSTKKSVVLTFDPTTHYVQFNATFVGLKPPAPVVEMLIDDFRKHMHVVGISAKYITNGVRVVGVVWGPTAYTDKGNKRIWTVTLKFPGPFDNITVVHGSYILGPNGTVILTFTQERTDYRLYALILLGIGAGIAGFFLWRRKRGGTASESESEPQESKSDRASEEESASSGESAGPEEPSENGSELNSRSDEGVEPSGGADDEP
ncbi:hypothetical protein [Thermococcus henrietii]|uniref:hypothetical protein n=1 Tax=Thermococcus henrietii TaxID=2016361 RepID=UPI0011AB5A9F|nr:hypothetical protein [Thermococcus henrietii]